MTINIDLNQLFNTAILAGINGATMLLVTHNLKKIIEKFEKKHKNEDKNNERKL